MLAAAAAALLSSCFPTYVFANIYPHPFAGAHLGWGYGGRACALSGEGIRGRGGGMEWIRRMVMLRAAEPELILRLQGGSRDHCPWERHQTLPNYYAELGVTTDANDKELRRAHKKMMLTYHPDKNAGSKLAEERFIRIQEAYAVLSQGVIRRDYDRARRIVSTSARPSSSRRTSSTKTPMPPYTTRATPARPSDTGSQQTQQPQQPARAPSAWAQQRTAEAAWEYGGEAGAAMARALRRQEKLRQDAAARARAALRQDKLGSNDAPAPSNAASPGPTASFSPSSPPAPGAATYSSHSAAATTPNCWRRQEQTGSANVLKGGKGAEIGSGRAGRGLGVGGGNFDWSKMESQMPFIKEVRQECAGVRNVRNEEDIAREVLRAEIAGGALAATQRGRSATSEWDARREALAERRLGAYAAQLLEEHEGGQGQEQVLGRGGLVVALADMLWATVLPQALDHIEALRAVKLVWRVQAVLGLTMAKDVRRDMLYSCFGRRLESIFIVSYAEGTGEGRGAAGRGAVGQGAVGQEAVGGAILIFDDPPIQDVEELIGSGCIDDRQGIGRGERKGGGTSNTQENLRRSPLQELQRMMGVEHLRVDWVVGGHVGEKMRRERGWVRQTVEGQSFERQSWDMPNWRDSENPDADVGNGWQRSVGGVSAVQEESRGSVSDFGQSSRSGESRIGRKEGLMYRRKERQRARAADEVLCGRFASGKVKDGGDVGEGQEGHRVRKLPSCVQKVFAAAVELQRQKEFEAVREMRSTGLGSQDESAGNPQCFGDDRLSDEEDEVWGGGGTFSENTKKQEKVSVGRDMRTEGANEARGWSNIGYSEVRNLATSFDLDGPITVLLPPKGAETRDARAQSQGVSIEDGRIKGLSRRERNERWRHILAARSSQPNVTDLHEQPQVQSEESFKQGAKQIGEDITRERERSALNPARRHPAKRSRMSSDSLKEERQGWEVQRGHKLGV